MKEYYERSLKREGLNVELVREAIAARLANGKITGEELLLYAEVLQNAECSVSVAESRYKEECEKEKP